jgi:voltage-gated potassium channel Kch
MSFMNNFHFLVILFVAVIIFGSVLMFYIESPNEDSKINNMLDSVWWVVATVTTVGYGDFTPVTDVGKIVAIFYMFFGIGILAIIVTTFASRFYQKLVKHETKEIESFFVEKFETLEENQEKLIKRFDDLLNSKKSTKDN